MLFLLLLVVYSIPPIDHNGNIFHHAIAPIFMGTTFIHRNHANSPKVLLGEVAQLMLDLFGVNDLCVSDILVGLVLVRKRQIKQVIDSRTSSMVDLIGKQDIEEKETVDMDEIYSGVAYGLARFDSSQPLFLNVSVIGKLSRYAEAVYGMPLKMYSNWKGGFGYMLNPRGGTPIDAVDAVERTMDDGCRTIFCCCPGAHRVDDIMHSDLIYISIKGSMFKSPFVVSVDHEHKAVIIATRGTLSTTDLLVDLYFKEEKIKWKYKGESIEAIAHHGIYRITTTILKELKDNRVFAIIQNQFPEYTLVCVGHSLGAAVSSLLAFLIKNDEELALFHSKTTAICYSPPAFTVSRPAIEYFKTFCTSVVFGDDFITRLNTRNIHILKEKIIRELSNCHERKIDLISSVFMAELFKQSPNRSMGANESLNSIPEPDVPEMMLPGNVLHIKRNFPNVSWELVEKENFTSSWVVEGTIEKEIIVSANMITDHFPNRVGNVLRGLFVNA